MKNVKKWIAIGLISMSAFSAAGCNMISKTPEGVAKSPVAKVNGEAITRGQIDREMTPIIAQIKAQYGDNYEKVPEAMDTLKQQKQQKLDDMIAKTILMQKAKELKLVPTDAELKKETDAKYAEVKTQFNNDDKAFKDALKQAGLTEEALRTQCSDAVIISKVTDSMFKGLKISDDELKKYYNENQTKFTEKPDRTHVAHILVDTEEAAKQVKARLDKGEDFAKVAKEVSKDGTKDKGGDLGFIEFNDANYDKMFMAAATVLSPNQISGPVQSSFGWHIIKCIAKETYPVKPLDKVKDEITQTLLDDKKNQVYTDTITKWRSQAKIKTYDNNLV